MDESAMAGQKIGTPARNAAVRMPFCCVSFQRWPPRRLRNSRDVYGPLVERGDEIADPDVVVAELFFAGVRVVDAIDAVVGERRVVDVRRAEIVMRPRVSCRSW